EAELEWIRNLRASCWSASLFVMLLVHPGISATMFHLFNCQNIYFDVESLAFQYWLVVDNRQECFTTSWWVAVVFAVLTLVIFVSGFPFFLWISMRHLRRHHRLSMPRELAEQQIDHVLAGRWIPASAHDVTNVRLYQSFYVRKKASRRLSSSQYFILPRLSLQSSFLYNPDSITDDTESEPTLVDLFVPKTFFTKCAGGDDASLEKAAKALQIPASEVANWPMACSASPSDAPPTSSMGGCADRPASSILLQNGKILTGVICHDQEIAVSGQVGLVLRAPVTMLDANAKVLSQFVAPFQNDFYFWQSYEIMRRLAQTGLVVLVSMLLGMNAAVLYAVVISVLAIIIHMRYLPYAEKAMNEFTLAILVNQFAIQIMIVAMRTMEGVGRKVLGISMLLLQFLLMSYALLIIIPAVRIIVSSLWSKTLIWRQASIRSLRRKGIVAATTSADCVSNVMLTGFSETNEQSQEWTNNPICTNGDSEPCIYPDPATEPTETANEIRTNRISVYEVNPQFGCEQPY
ncbi:hypothetical protein CYMTET_20783, partial [Cymbomonas tetramitiformis]